MSYDAELHIASLSDAIHRKFVLLFTARRCASAAYAVVCQSVRPSVRPSVCLSVCLSQAGIVSKPQNTGSHIRHHTIAQGIYFSGAKDLREIRPGSTHKGAPNAGRVD